MQYRYRTQIAALWRCLRYALAALALLALLSAKTAFAHPQIVSSEPAEGAQLAASPARARLVFSEQVEIEFSRIQVFDAQGTPVDRGTGGRIAADPAVLEVALPPLPPGVYTVAWQTVGVDGHQVKGNWSFQVIGAVPSTTAGAGSPAATAPPAQLSATAMPMVAVTSPPTVSVAPALPVAAALLRTLMLLGALGAVGGWAVALLVLWPTFGASAAGIWRTWVALCLGLLLFACGVVVASTTLDLSGHLTPDALGMVLGATRFGQALLARALLGLAFLIVLVLPGAGEQTAWSTPLAALLGGGLLLTFALSGHAGAEGLPILPALADWLHLAAAALWVGGLLVIVLALPGAVRRLPVAARGGALVQVMQRFAPLALLSVALLAVTGTYSALLYLQTPSQLLTSAYGRALLVKLALFGGLLLLGAYQRLGIGPGLSASADQATLAAHAERWPRRFVLMLRSEVVLGLLVLVAVGFLTSLPTPTLLRLPGSAVTSTPGAAPPLAAALAPGPTSLPAAPTRTPVPSRPFTQTQAAADLTVGLEVKPASIFKNTFLVQVRDGQGQPLDAQLVRLTFSMLSMDMGTRQIELTPAGPGRYTTTASPLSMVGDWQVQVLVRRSDVDDVRVDFKVPVGE